MRLTLSMLALASAWPGLALGADPIAQGRLIAQMRCGSCHATGAEDASPLPKAPPMRELSTRWPVDDLAEALAEGIVTGHAAMPEVVLEPEEIDAFLAYLGALSE